MFEDIMVFLGVIAIVFIGIVIGTLCISALLVFISWVLHFSMMLMP